jgi:hypothetical protein
MDVNRPRGRLLTYSNLVAQAVYHAKHNGIEGPLKDVVTDMMRHTDFRFSRRVRGLMRKGAPPQYEQDFEKRMGRV